MDICYSAESEISTSYVKPETGKLDVASSSLVSTAARHFFDVVVHSCDEENVLVWAQTIRRHLSQNVEGACWFLSCIINGEWSRELLLETNKKFIREAMASIILVAVKTVLPYERDDSADVISYSAALIDSMMSSINYAAKFWEHFDQYFILLRDLAIMSPLRTRLIRQKGVSQLINLFLNEESPQELKKEFGAIPMLGNHITSPSYYHVLDTVAVLIGVLKTPRDPIFVDNTVPRAELELTAKAESAFSRIFDKFAPNGKMSTGEFVKFCVASGAGGEGINAHLKIKTEKVKEIFKTVKLYADGTMPKESFIEFYFSAAYKNVENIWNDFRHLKFSADLVYMGSPTPAEYSLVSVDDVLPSLCAQVVKWRTFQQNLLSVSSSCRMAVPMLLSSIQGPSNVHNSTEGFESDVSLLRIAIDALVKAKNAESAIHGSVDLLRQILGKDDQYQEERMEMVFLDKVSGLIELALAKSTNMNQYPGAYNTATRTYIFIKAVSLLLESSAVRSFLTQHKKLWGWMVPWLKSASLKNKVLGGNIDFHKRDPAVVSVIDQLAEVQGMPTVEDDMKKLQNGTAIVEGAGNRIVDGTYRFDGFFGDVPKYAMTVEPDPSVPASKPMKLTMFRCKLQRGHHQWYISEMNPTSPGTDKDIDYYFCRSESRIPPESGWKSVTRGVAPGPLVQLANVYVPEEIGVPQMNYNPQISHQNFDDSSSDDEPSDDFHVI